MHRRQPVPLHRLPEHRRGRCRRAGARLDRRASDRGGRMTTKLFGRAGPARWRTRGSCAASGRYVDDRVGSGALHAAFVRSPHAHARIRRHRRRPTRSTSTGVIAIYTYEDLAGPMAEPLPLLIPHPALTHGRTAVRAGQDEVNHVGEAIVDRGRRATATSPRTPSAGSGSTTSRCRPVVGIEAAPGRATLVHDDVPGNVGAHLVQEASATRRRRDRRRRRTRWPSTSTSSAARACRWRAAACTPAGTPTTGRARLHLAPRPRPASARRSPPSWACRWPGRGDRARRRRRLRRQDHAPVARGDAGAVGGDARSAGRSSGPRTGASTSSPRRTSAARCTTSGSGSTTTGRLLGLDVRFWHDHGAYTPYGHHRPDHHLDPAARAVQARRLPGRVRLASTPTP